jgi:hypothetical protein
MVVGHPEVSCPVGLRTSSTTTSPSWRASTTSTLLLSSAWSVRSSDPSASRWRAALFPTRGKLPSLMGLLSCSTRTKALEPERSRSVTSRSTTHFAVAYSCTAEVVNPWPSSGGTWAASAEALADREWGAPAFSGS